MSILFFFAFVSLALVLSMSLEDINPFQSEPLSMLEQIEFYMSKGCEEVRDRNDLPLAA